MTCGRVVVLGLGNRFRGDDAAGLEVAARLRRLAPAGVDIVEHEGEATALVDLWQGATLALVVDAVRSGAPPGTLHRLELDADGSLQRTAVADRGWQVSSHALGLGEAIRLARALGRLPRHLVLVGIEGASFAAGAGLSPPVAKAVQQLAQDLPQELAHASPS